MRTIGLKGNKWLLLSIAAMATIAASSGCMGLTSHLMWWMSADTVPAEFSGLRGRRVAVLCESEKSAFGADSETEMLAREIEKLMRYTDPPSEMVRYQEIADWKDQHGDDELSYGNLGKGVGAEMVLAVDLKSFSSHANQTIYQGKAEYNVKVYDVAKGQIVYESNTVDFMYPSDDAFHTTEMSDSQFLREFIKWLANDVTQRFYPTKLTETIGGREDNR